jgi:phage terminase large subunit
MHFDRKKRTLYIFREVYGIGVGNRALFDRLAPEERRTLTIADSAEPKSIDELKGYGMNIRGATKGPGSVEHGIKWLSELERIVIDPARCPNAAREFVNYALELNRQGEVISRYPDKDNHFLDQTRYALQDDMKQMLSAKTNPRAAMRI